MSVSINSSRVAPDTNGLLCSSRRRFLGLLAGAGAGAALAGLGKSEAALALGRGSSTDLVDVNVSLSRWPTRRLPNDEPQDLAKQLRRHGVRQAWVGSFEALLQKDLAAVNARLAHDCRRYGNRLFLPFGSVNPAQADWETELDRCVRVHRMRGLRLFPNYHGYKLDHPEFGRLLKRAAELRLIVQVALVMEDERMMHPFWRAEPVDTRPLVALIRATPGLRLVLVNALRTLRGTALRELLEAGDVSVEFSMLEGVGGLESLLDRTPVERVLFGSHAPLFYFESAELKLRESALAPAQLRSIRSENARRLLASDG